MKALAPMMCTLTCAWLCALLCAPCLQARPADRHELAPSPGSVDVVGDVDGTQPPVAKAANDTIWIATWNFEGCDDTGWVRADNHILNDGNVYWQINTNYSGVAHIVDEAAAVFIDDLCLCTNDTGYLNDWMQGIRVRYVGDSHLSFDFLMDSEGGYDFLRVETDSACASFSLVDYATDPSGNAASFRDVLWSVSGFDTTTARLDSLFLPGYASSDTHCAYVTFFSDGSFATCDGLLQSGLGAGAVIDNILLEGAHPQSEDFTGFTPSPDLEFINLQDSEPFGSWARIYQHITDNDTCTEDLSCAWLATDDTTPTLANDTSMDFGPSGYVIKNWLDETLVGPWASLASTPEAIATFVQFRRFGGNRYNDGRIVQNWSIRGRTTISNTDTPAPGDSLDCISNWGHAAQWNSLTSFEWRTLTWNATSEFDPASSQVQMRFRTSDWQWLRGASPPTTFNPGPGPFWDRVRIGRHVLTGPVIDEGIDARYQAQDAAPNDPAFPSGPMYSQAAGGDIFGTTAFSRSTDTGPGNSSNLIVADSITVDVEDILGNGGLTIEVYASIVAGPHVGKAPAPYTVGANGFFLITAEQSRTTAGQIFADRYFVDLDDTYFRGGDVLHYLWYTTDAAGGVTSHPAGLTAVPTSVAEAELATGGLFEVSFLPTNDWDPAYLARIQADPHGALDPTPAELANSSQAHCILYYQNVNARRLSGDANRTSFMYTLDRLGYRDAYDVYDLTGLGNTNNQLGARMSPEQARSYSILVYDSGNRGPGSPILPDGVDFDAEKIDMGAWFQSWNALSGAPNPEHTFWFIGANALDEKPSNALFTTMGVSLFANDQGQGPNPNIFGVANFTNHVACLAPHMGELFAANGGCPEIRDYDDIRGVGTGVQTHSYGTNTSSSAGAIVMNANAAGYTTIMQSVAWSDIRNSTGSSPSQPAATLLDRVLSCALQGGCGGSSTVDVDDKDVLAVPAHTALHQNTPNPFNPTTTIHFDLARNTHVSLKVYDVAGRQVRSVASKAMFAGYDRQVTWNGRDDAGKRVSSGVYFYRLEAGDYAATRKLVVMK